MHVLINGGLKFTKDSICAAPAKKTPFSWLLLEASFAKQSSDKQTSCANLVPFTKFTKISLLRKFLILQNFLVITLLD